MEEQFDLMEQLFEPIFETYKCDMKLAERLHRTYMALPGLEWVIMELSARKN